MTSPRRNNAAGGLAQGTQPTAAEAASIVLASCAPEFPSATLANTMGYLYPLQDARSIFSDRVVDNCSSGGFKMPPAKIPLGDSNTLGDVAHAVQGNAVAP